MKMNQISIAGMLLVITLLSFATVANAQMMSESEVTTFSNVIDSSFDGRGQIVWRGLESGYNSADLTQNLYREFSQKFRSFPWPAKSILNNQRMNVAIRLSPTITQRFVVVIENETIVSFMKGQSSNPTMNIEMDYGTFSRVASWDGHQTLLEEELPRSIKDGSVVVTSNDTIHGFLISIYKLFI